MKTEWRITCTAVIVQIICGLIIYYLATMAAQTPFDQQVILACFIIIGANSIGWFAYYVFSGWMRRSVKKLISMLVIAAIALLPFNSRAQVYGPPKPEVTVCEVLIVGVMGACIVVILWKLHGACVKLIPLATPPPPPPTNSVPTNSISPRAISRSLSAAAIQEFDLPTYDCSPWYPYLPRYSIILVKASLANTNLGTIQWWRNGYDNWTLWTGADGMRQTNYFTGPNPEFILPIAPQSQGFFMLCTNIAIPKP